MTAVPAAVPAAFHADWTRLWQMAQRVVVRTGAKTAHAFLNVGLRLEDPAAPPHDGEYTSSPANATMFAATGGDAVHFSVLHTPGTRDRGAIVMTAPMAYDQPNLVVGDGLAEFLALGCRTAYYGLDQLLYQRQRMINRLESAEPQHGTEEANLLQALVDEFGLAPWRNVGLRLAALDAKYRSTIHLHEHDRLR
jgi:hypothetical protein